MARTVELLAGEKYRGESSKAVIACNDYLRMGPKRSLRTLEVQYREMSRTIAPTHSVGTLNKWSADYGWQERAQSYDAEMEAEKTEQEKARQRETAERRKSIMEAGAALDFERVDRLRRLLGVLEEQIFYSPDTAEGTIESAIEESLNRLEILNEDMAEIARALMGKFDASDPRGKFPNMWARDVKVVGKGDSSRTVSVVRFNTPLLAEYRSLLDDIAKETGGRRQRTVTENIDYGKLTDEQLQRVSSGEDPIQVILSDYASRQS